MKHAQLNRSLLACILLLAMAALLPLGCKGSQSPGSTNAAPHLEEFNAQGVYTPYYGTGEMATPRYLHQAIRLKNGFILISGGSDERGFASLDTAEIFDEVSTRKGETKPPSLTGVWLDTDFEGNPIVMEFRRFWHTMTTLPDNRVIVIGGAANWIKARAYERVEIFDPLTRKFETLKDAKLFLPRVRFTTNTLPDGNLLITGGQYHSVFTDIQQGQASGFGSTGTVSFAFQTDIFPSTDSAELFNFRDLKFEKLTLPESTRLSKLSSSRGRAGHVSVRFAGFDNKLETGDDLFLLVGGLQTPGAPALVQQTMITRYGGGFNIPLKNMEIYDPVTRLFTLIGSVQLRVPRVNDPQATNLGIFNENTPDNVPGMANVILVTHGDNDVQCYNVFPQDEVFAAVFTGLGPAQGLVVNRITYATNFLDDGHYHAIEAMVNLDSQGLPPSEFDPLPPPGRTMTNIVPLAREVQVRPGENATSTWVYAGSGAHVICTPPGPVDYYDGTVGAGCLFDPLYRLIPAADYVNLTPKPNARDLKAKRDDFANLTGVMGTWLALDGKYPSTDRIGFGDTIFSYTGEIWAHNQTRRVWTTLIAVAGEDGIFDTPDDRVLHTGGGVDALDTGGSGGGEPSIPSAEICLIPKSPP